MIYGYARISTSKQSIERQIRGIRNAYPAVQRIYQEAFTGTVTDRPQFSKLLKIVKPGDTIIFDSVSRMSRNAEEGFQLYQELMEKGVDLVFLKEPQIDSKTYKSGLQIDLPVTENAVLQPILDGVKKALAEVQKAQIRIAFEQAEKEVTDLRQRTREGIQTARINGKSIGRPTGSGGETAKAQDAKIAIKKHSRTFGGSLSDGELIRLLGISRNSFYKYKKQLRGKQEA